MARSRPRQRSTWKVLAVFNHTLGQIFISATDAPLAAVTRQCRQIASELVGWEPPHDIDWIEQVESFPNERSAKLYANWLYREGAFEGLEDYAIGIDATCG